MPFVQLSRATSGRASAFCLVSASFLLAGPALATTVTVNATDFTVTYDTSTLGQFGSLAVVGDNLFFTPNNFKAESLNGSGVVTDDSTASGIVLTAHAGYHFGSLSLAEFGDYKLLGASSTVSVTGQLRAFDQSNPLFTQTTSAITPTGSLPLTVIDGATHNWSATAQIDASTVPLTGGTAWLGQAGTIDLTIENLLTAYTAPGAGPQDAFIEKKFNGAQVSVVPATPVPLPGSLGLLATAVALGAGVIRRNGRPRG